ncbi:MAG: tRNA (adenosine(37)-N6)-threonylcarbamoyltransferase complex dimerization subunit type 1 TsaB [Senegalia sp. (in: firmicutes)]|uniref:tRNA (adenosine(37)-N6)-threonylcarbamoyltransferase complex dimerization subunit type 1 TsaB n=1 Tax=Senegalia sp. (in: firmicutes) TaxID=1924098 RepID=UPI003F9AB96D
MKILVIESSTRVATCAVMDDDSLLGEHIINDNMTHSVKLMPSVASLMENLGLQPKDIDVYAVAVGPGSFTGLRIGIASIKAMAHAHKKKTIAIPTMDALAFNIPFADGIIVPMLDARRDRVYCGIYKWVDSKFIVEMEQDVLNIKDLIDLLKKRDEKIIINGDVKEKYEDMLKEELGERVIFSTKAGQMPRASSVAELALIKFNNNESIDYKDLLPEYLRKSQAERQYDEKINKKNE